MVAHNSSNNAAHVTVRFVSQQQLFIIQIRGVIVENFGISFMYD